MIGDCVIDCSAAPFKTSVTARIGHGRAAIGVSAGGAKAELRRPRLSGCVNVGARWGAALNPFGPGRAAVTQLITQTHRVMEQIVQVAQATWRLK